MSETETSPARPERPSVDPGSIDKVPGQGSTAEYRQAFADAPAAVRAAAYLNSIRKMLIFFTVVTVVGLVVGIVLAIIGIHAIDSANQQSTTVQPLGQ